MPDMDGPNGVVDALTHPFPMALLWGSAGVRVYRLQATMSEVMRAADRNTAALKRLNYYLTKDAQT